MDYAAQKLEYELDLPEWPEVGRVTEGRTYSHSGGCRSEGCDNFPSEFGSCHICMVTTCS
jgi:hypothetical protein